jgi:predicted RNA-binding protein with TRAM domain
LTRWNRSASVQKKNLTGPNQHNSKGNTHQFLQQNTTNKMATMTNTASAQVQQTKNQKTKKPKITINKKLGLKKLNNNLIKTQNEKKQINEFYDNLHKKCEQLEQKIAEDAKQLERYHKMNEEFRYMEFRTVPHLKEEVNTWIKKFKKAESEASVNKHWRDVVDEYKGKTKTMKAQRDKKQKEIRDLKAENSKLVDENAKLEEEFQKANTAYLELAGNGPCMEAEIARLTKENSKLKQDLEFAEEPDLLTVMEGNEEFENLKAENSALKNSNDKLEKELQHFKTKSSEEFQQEVDEAVKARHYDLINEMNAVKVELEQLKRKKTTKSKVQDNSGDNKAGHYVLLVRNVKNKDNIICKIAKAKKKYATLDIFMGGKWRQEDKLWSKLNKIEDQEAAKQEFHERADRILKNLKAAVEHKREGKLRKIMNDWTMKQRIEYILEMEPSQFTEDIKYHYKYEYSMKNREKTLKKHGLFKKFMEEKQRLDDGEEFQIDIAEAGLVFLKGRQSRAKKQTAPVVVADSS